MRDLDDLRDALHAPTTQPFAALDLDQVMRDGRRLRRRRRLLGAGVATAALGPVLLLMPLLGDPDSGVRPPTTIQVTSGGPTPETATSTLDPRTDPPIGKLVSTGIGETDGGKQVLYLVNPGSSGRQSCTVVAGRRVAGGRVVGDVVAEPLIGRTGPGLRSLSRAVVDGRYIPVFGCYYGPVERISATTRGRSVDAHLSTWSRNSDFTMFWFFSNELAPADPVTAVTGYDADGSILDRWTPPSSPTR